MDTGTWPRELGLEHYERKFVDSDIEISLLTDLTGADLEKLGVGSLGHHKLLTRAISTLDHVDLDDVIDEAADIDQPAYGSRKWIV